MAAPASPEVLAQKAEEAAETDAAAAAALAHEALAADPENARAANVLPGADDDMRANFEQVARQLGTLGYDPSSTRLGAEWARRGDANLVARTAAIPSATVPGERNLMREYVEL